MGRVVAVVGGGISGLGAARALAGGPPTGGRLSESRPGDGPARAAAGGRGGEVEVVVLEADDRFGGKVLSGEFRGCRVDFGPDNFLTRNDSVVELCDQLGIGRDLVAPATSSASVVARGRLRPMPAGLILGLPPDLGVLARSRIVSARGLARAAFDLLPGGEPMSAASLGLDDEPVPGRAYEAGGSPEWSAGSLLRRRLGNEVVDRLVDPLLGGINAGGVDQLSLSVVAPQVARALVGHKSVTRALRSMARSARAPSRKSSKPRPYFLGLEGGLGRIVDELVADLRSRGVKLRSGTAVTALRRAGNRYELDTPGGTVTADGVVLAAPAYVVGRLLVNEAPAAAAELGSIPHSGVALVTLAWPCGSGSGLPPGSGFLVPRCERRVVTGCTFLSAKWPLTAAPGEVVIRASTGRYGDDRAASMSDEELVDTVLGELRVLLGLSGPPLASCVQRWPRAFPQYLPGHLRKIGRAVAALHDLPALELAGPALGGIGIPACLTSGERAGMEVLGHLGA